MNRPGKCRVCIIGDLETILDLGVQAISNRFQATATGVADSHGLALARCPECGQIQLGDPAEASLVRSPHPWISYIEPEGHLDRVVDEICALPGAGPVWRIGSITYKDESTQERFRRRGWDNQWRLDPQLDLELPVDSVDLASIQEHLSVERAHRAAARLGKADVLLVRHILEHAVRPREFMAALAELVVAGGLIVFECPDSQKAFHSREYTVIWEEHMSYFTPELMARFFGCCHADLERLIVFPYPVENALVGLVRARHPSRSPAKVAPVKLAEERREMMQYAEDFPKQKQAWHSWLAERRGRVALFGAGHTTCAFVNYFGLASAIEFVADDHPRKQGWFLPGSGLPIRSSEALLATDIEHCLMGLSPESENRVMASQAPAVANGIQFASVFPMSDRLAEPMRTGTAGVPEVLRPTDRLPRFDDAGVARLRQGVRGTARRRNRFCGHLSATDALHEMIICLHAETYVRPHCHRRKPESIHVVEGHADLVVFSDTGAVTEIVPLGPRDSGLAWYLRIPEGVVHTLVLRGETFVFQETTLGPFDFGATEVASWAPAEGDKAGIASHKAQLVSAVLTAAARAAGT